MQLVSIKTVAELLSVKPSTLYSWVHNGSIPFHKLNGLIRFDLDEIEAWIKAAKLRLGSPFHRSEANHQDIDKIIRKAVDSAKSKEYNRVQRETRPNTGSQKEG